SNRKTGFATTGRPRKSSSQQHHHHHYYNNNNHHHNNHHNHHHPNAAAVVRRSRSFQVMSAKEEHDLKMNWHPEGDDYKLVFISSDSSKDSELNSSIDSDTCGWGGTSSGGNKRVTNTTMSGFVVDENEWDYYDSKGMNKGRGGGGNRGSVGGVGVSRVICPPRVDACVMTEGDYLSGVSDEEYSDLDDLTSDDLTPSHLRHDSGVSTESPPEGEDGSGSPIPHLTTNTTTTTTTNPLHPTIPTTFLLPLDTKDIHDMLKQTEAVQAEAQALQAALMGAFTPVVGGITTTPSIPTPWRLNSSGVYSPPSSSSSRNRPSTTTTTTTPRRHRCSSPSSLREYREKVLTEIQNYYGVNNNNPSSSSSTTHNNNNNNNNNNPSILPHSPSSPAPGPIHPYYVEEEEEEEEEEKNPLTPLHSPTIPTTPSSPPPPAHTTSRLSQRPFASPSRPSTQPPPPTSLLSPSTPSQAYPEAHGGGGRGGGRVVVVGVEKKKKKSTLSPIPSPSPSSSHTLYLSSPHHLSQSLSSLPFPPPSSSSSSVSLPFTQSHSSSLSSLPKFPPPIITTPTSPPPQQQTQTSFPNLSNNPTTSLLPLPQQHAPPHSLSLFPFPPPSPLPHPPSIHLHLTLSREPSVVHPSDSEADDRLAEVSSCVSSDLGGDSTSDFEYRDDVSECRSDVAVKQVRWGDDERAGSISGDGGKEVLETTQPDALVGLYTPTEEKNKKKKEKEKEKVLRLGEERRKKKEKEEELLRREEERRSKEEEKEGSADQHGGRGEGGNRGVSRTCSRGEKERQQVPPSPSITPSQTTTTNTNSSTNNTNTNSASMPRAKGKTNQHHSSGGSSSSGVSSSSSPCKPPTPTPRRKMSARRPHPHHTHTTQDSTTTTPGDVDEPRKVIQDMALSSSTNTTTTINSTSSSTTTTTANSTNSSTTTTTTNTTPSITTTTTTTTASISPTTTITTTIDTSSVSISPTLHTPSPHSSPSPSHNPASHSLGHSPTTSPPHTPITSPRSPTSSPPHTPTTSSPPSPTSSPPHPPTTSPRSPTSSPPHTPTTTSPRSPITSPRSPTSSPVHTSTTSPQHTPRTTSPQSSEDDEGNTNTSSSYTSEAEDTDEDLHASGSYNITLDEAETAFEDEDTEGGKKSDVLTFDTSSYDLPDEDEDTEGLGGRESGGGGSSSMSSSLSSNESDTDEDTHVSKQYSLAKSSSGESSGGGLVKCEGGDEDSENNDGDERLRDSEGDDERQSDNEGGDSNDNKECLKDSESDDGGDKCVVSKDNENEIDIKDNNGENEDIEGNIGVDVIMLNTEKEEERKEEKESEGERRSEEEEEEMPVTKEEDLEETINKEEEEKEGIVRKEGIIDKEEGKEGIEKEEDEKEGIERGKEEKEYRIEGEAMKSDENESKGIEEGKKMILVEAIHPSCLVVSDDKGVVGDEKGDVVENRSVVDDRDVMVGDDDGSSVLQPPTAVVEAVNLELEVGGTEKRVESEKEEEEEERNEKGEEGKEKNVVIEKMTNIEEEIDTNKGISENGKEEIIGNEGGNEKEKEEVLKQDESERKEEEREEVEKREKENEGRGEKSCEMKSKGNEGEEGNVVEEGIDGGVVVVVVVEGRKSPSIPTTSTPSSPTTSTPSSPPSEKVRRERTRASDDGESEVVVMMEKDIMVEKEGEMKEEEEREESEIEKPRGMESELKDGGNAVKVTEESGNDRTSAEKMTNDGDGESDEVMVMKGEHDKEMNNDSGDKMKDENDLNNIGKSEEEINMKSESDKNMNEVDDDSESKVSENDETRAKSDDDSDFLDKVVDENGDDKKVTVVDDDKLLTGVGGDGVTDVDKLTSVEKLGRINIERVEDSRCVEEEGGGGRQSPPEASTPVQTTTTTTTTTPVTETTTITLDRPPTTTTTPVHGATDQSNTTTPDIITNLPSSSDKLVPTNETKHDVRSFVVVEGERSVGIPGESEQEEEEEEERRTGGGGTGGVEEAAGTQEEGVEEGEREEGFIAGSEQMEHGTSSHHHQQHHTAAVTSVDAGVSARASSTLLTSSSPQHTRRPPPPPPPPTSPQKQRHHLQHHTTSPKHPITTTTTTTSDVIVSNSIGVGVGASGSETVEKDSGSQNSLLSTSVNLVSGGHDGSEEGVVSPLNLVSSVAQVENSVASSPLEVLSDNCQAQSSVSPSLPDASEACVSENCESGVRESSAKGGESSESGHSSAGESEDEADANGNVVKISVTEGEESQQEEGSQISVVGSEVRGQQQQEVNRFAVRRHTPLVPTRRTKRSSSSDGVSSSSDIERSDADASDSADTVVEGGKLHAELRQRFSLHQRRHDHDDKARDSDGPSSADSVLHGADSESQCSDNSEEGNLVSIVSVGDDEDRTTRLASGRIYIRSDSTDSDVQIKPTCIVVTGSSGIESGEDIDADKIDRHILNNEGNDVTILEVTSDARRGHVMSVHVTSPDSSRSASPARRSQVSELQSMILTTRERQQQFRRSPTEMRESSSSLAKYFTLTLGTESPHAPRRLNKTPEVRRRKVDRPEAAETPATPSPTTPTSPARTPDHSEGDLLAYEEQHGIDIEEEYPQPQEYDSWEDGDRVVSFPDEVEFDEDVSFDENNQSFVEGEEFEGDDIYIDHEVEGQFDSIEDGESNYSESNYSESSGDEGCDREEELRGYCNRAIDFTLHTIIEESCEESDYERKPREEDGARADPSELEKYFYFGLGNGPADPKRFANEESEYSDTFSETSSSVFSEGVDIDPQDDMDPAELASSRIEKYFLTGFMFERQPSIRSVGEDSELHTDESGSVGSDSEGSPSPEQPRKKQVRRPRGFRLGVANRCLMQSGDRYDGAPSDGSHHSEGDEVDRTLVSGEEEASTESEEIAFDKSDGQFDTIKRRKKKKNSGDYSDKKSDSDKSELKTVEQQHDDHRDDIVDFKHCEALKSLIHEEREKVNKRVTIECDKDSKDRSEERMEKEGDLADRKYQSRDSGFIGSSDDLLKDKPEDSSKDQKGRSSSESSVEEGEGSSKRNDSSQDAKKKHEKKGDSFDNDSNNNKSESEGRSSGDGGKVSRSSTGSSVDLPPFCPDKARSKICRKDSFNNWSSDEETNMMMNKMRAFFKTMISNNREAPKGQRVKPPQLVAFEAKLTNLMKTVPGINDVQVKEIVEYLSSEDTWSDSYDSSDYTSSDLEGAYALLDQADPEMRSDLQEQISASCQQIIQKFDQSREPSDTDSAHSLFGGRAYSESSEDTANSSKDTVIMYQRLMSSISRLKPDSDRGSIGSGSQGASPPLLAKVMHHIGNRLVALMHEVSGGSENGDDDSLNGGLPVTSSPRVPLFLPRKYNSVDSISFEEKSSLTSTSFESEDSPTDTEQSPESDPGTPKARSRRQAQGGPLSIISERSSAEDFTSLESQRTVFASHDSPRHQARLDAARPQHSAGSERSLVERGVTNIQYFVTEGSNNEVEVWQSVTIDEDKFDAREHHGVPRVRRSARRQEARKAKSHMSLEKIHQEEVKTTGERSESLGDLLDRVRSSEFSSSYEQLDSDSTLKASDSLDRHIGSSSSNIRLNASSRGSLTTSSRGSLAASSRGSLNAGSRGSLQGSSGPEEEEEKKPKKLNFFRYARRSSMPDTSKDRMSPEVRSTTLPRSNPTQVASTASLPRSQFLNKTPPSVTHTTMASTPSTLERAVGVSMSGPRSARYHAPGYRPPPPSTTPKRTLSTPGLSAFRKDSTSSWTNQGKSTQ
ncbi:hypothetical protein Pmani_029495, partial [Petrolisthes manimaculis]